MLPSSTPPSEPYVECARRLRQLHALIRSGDGDSAEADELRDEMDLLWNRMPSEEREWTGKLSADLHLLGEGSRLREDRPTDAGIRRALLAAGRGEDWEGLRSLLDSSVNEIDGGDSILFIAIYWAGLGDLPSSLVFLEAFAARLTWEKIDVEAKQASLEELVSNLGRDASDGRAQVASVRELGLRALQAINHVHREAMLLCSMVEAALSREGCGRPRGEEWSPIKDQFFVVEACKPATPVLAA